MITDFVGSYEPYSPLMKFADKIVTTIPLNILWTNDTEVQAERSTYLSPNDIRSLLKESPVQFIVADVGHKLKWIDDDQCFDFWKAEKNHIAENPGQVNLEDFIDNYAYIASRWTGEQDIPIVLLEKVH